MGCFAFVVRRLGPARGQARPTLARPLVVPAPMTRFALASALLLVTFATGCGGRYYRARYVYAVQGPPVAVVAVRGPILAPAEAPPAPPPAPPMPPPPAAGPRPIIVHAPPGSVVIVNPGGRPQVVQQQAPQVAPPPPQEAPEAPEQPAEPQDQGWFEGGR